jgi:two-component system cell cycle sensor histidine kinase/response regulator CckA
MGNASWQPSCYRLASEDRVAPGEPENTTILVVEDGETVRKLVCAMLAQQGYRVLEACDGDQALHLIRSNEKIHLVVTDLMMPGIGGVELAETLGKIRPSVPVVFMSGFAEDPVVADLSTRPARFIAKPFTAQSLIEKVQQALNHR